MRTILLILGSLAAAAFAADSEIVKWNKLLLAQIKANKVPPPVATRYLALLHVSQYEAVNTLTGTCMPYLFDQPLAHGSLAIAEPAAAQAGHDILTTLFPAASADFSTALIESLLSYNGMVRTHSIALGTAAAQALLLNRTGDGADAASTPAYALPSPLSDGDWRPTAPGYKPFLLPNWGDVKPWALNDASQFQPATPPRPLQTQYTNELDEVRYIGGSVSILRTAEQTDIARLWEADPGTVTPPGMWFEIAAQLSASNSLALADEARLFALLGISVADAAITAWHTKRTYATWRPITAITLGVDTTWSSLLTTPPFPGYISGHSIFSSSSATLLALVLGSDIQPEFTAVGAGVTRSFTSLYTAASEAGQSRIYGGIHFQSDNEQGLITGAKIANAVVSSCGLLLESNVVTSPTDTNTTDDDDEHHHSHQNQEDASAVLIVTMIFAILCFILLVVILVLVVRKHGSGKRKSKGKKPKSTDARIGDYVDPYSAASGAHASVFRRGGNTYAHAGAHSGSSWWSGDWAVTGGICCCLILLFLIPLGFWFFFSDGFDHHDAHGHHGSPHGH